MLEKAWRNPLPRDDTPPEPLPEVVPAPAQSISDFFKGVPSRRVDIVSPVTPPPDEIERERMRQQAELMRRVPAGQREGGQFVEKKTPTLSNEDLIKLDSYGSFAPLNQIDTLYLRLSGNQGRLIKGTNRRTAGLTPIQLKSKITELVKAAGELPPEIRDYRV